MLRLGASRLAQGKPGSGGSGWLAMSEHTMAGESSGAPCRTRTCDLLVRRRHALAADRSRPRISGVGCLTCQFLQGPTCQPAWPQIPMLATDSH